MTKDVYLALDFPTWNETKTFLDRHHLQGIPVKVGMELFYREGAFVINQLKQAGHKVFLDLKLHDIPTTVQKAMSNLSCLDIDMTTIHALGGSAMMQAAKEGLQTGSNTNAKLLAVTILTSVDQSSLNDELGISGDVTGNVDRLALQAKKNGIDGVVCSVHEANYVKGICGGAFKTVTPGIRLQNNGSDDQHRVATPAFARTNGADMIVVGRSVTGAEDPNQAYKTIRKAWENNVKRGDNERFTGN